MANLKDLIVNGAARIIGKTYSSEFVGNVTGDVTGNAATSSKLKTAVSLTTTDGTNTSTGVNFDGSTATSIKLPKTISATFSGDLTGNVTGSVSGNAGTATKLKTARSLKITDDGTNTSTGVDFDGSDAVTLKLPSTIKASLAGNATTATTADKTAYGISVGDGVSSTAAISGWKGSETKTLAIKGTSPITTTATTDTITITHNKGGANTSKGDTDNQAPGFGGTFRVTSATVDVYGHTTTLAEHTVTIPSTEASTSASGIVTTGPQTFAGAKTFNDTITGSITGNAGTATKLKTARSLKITDGTNTSNGVDFDGASDVTLNLPTTIKATFSGNLTGDVTGNVSGSSGSCTGNAATASIINGTYTGNGGAQPPSYIGSGKVRFNMMNSFSGLTSLPTYADCILMDTYGGSDVPYVTGLGIIKASGNPRAFIAVGAKNNTTTWISQAELITSAGGTINGTLTATKVWGAVFNDLADAIPVGEGDVLEAGYCYGFDGEHYTKTSEYMQKSYIGIHSDTYGFKMGHEEGKEKLNVAVSGFVLAYVDREYEVGTPLTCTAEGCLTEIKLEDKIKYPERVVATYWKNEPNEEWGPEGKKVKVNGRRWVKVK